MKKFWLLIPLLIPGILAAQGLIVNEISNGTSGGKEYIELVAIGSALNPTGVVNLENWVLDDNNGDFEGSGSGVGISTGHLRFAPGCVTSVAPGTIILIYNPADLNTAITPGASDPVDANGDCVFIFPVDDGCVEQGLLQPITGSPSYTPTSYVPATTWTPEPLGLRNTGDAVQVRDPAYNFFHGFCYGLVAPFPNFPAVLGGGPSFSLPGPGGGNVYFFNCGDFTNPANFSTGAALFSQTPGAPNNPQNQYFLNALRSGLYDYSNLANPTNCGTAPALDPCPTTVLNISLVDFVGEKQGDVISMEWQTEDYSSATFEIERSRDGSHFETIGEIAGEGRNHFGFVDVNPQDVNHYRLKMKQTGKKPQYSRRLYFELENQPVIRSFFMENRLHIDFGQRLKQSARITLVNLQGRVVAKSVIASGSDQWEMEAAGLARGIYMAKIDLGASVEVFKLVW